MTYLVRTSILAILITILGGFATPPEGCTIVFAGDSITDGAWGGSNGTKIPTSGRNHSDLNHIFGHSYMMLCAARLSADLPEEGLRFYNRGISGNNLSDLENRWEEDILSLNPDVISILIGTNDVNLYLAENQGKEFDYGSWGDRYRKLLDKAREVNPDVKFIIATPFTARSGQVGNPPDYMTRAAMIEKLGEVVCQTARDYNAKLIRYDNLFQDILKQHPEVSSEYWIWDGIHPTPAGHQLMADEWIKTFKEFREDKP